MWETILTTAGTVFVTLLVTFTFNWIVARPKKVKETREKEFNAFKEEIVKALDKVAENRHLDIETREQEHRETLELLNKYHTQLTQEDTVMRKGIQAIIKNELKGQYCLWVKRGYAPIDIKDDLEKMYQVYHQLGANGVMDRFRKEFMELPEFPPEKR